jgi:glycosyltransferase involved in cell wall biosynthesis
VGRFQPQKNLKVVIDAFADAFAGRDVRLRLVGDGPLKSDLVHQVQQRGIEHQVEFLPWQDKQGLLTQYQSAHCLINYSLYEGMPNVVLEAIACGLPVILSDIMGHQELAENDPRGTLVSVENTNELNACMLNAVSYNRTREDIGTISETDASWLQVADQYLTLSSQSSLL